MGSPIRIGRLAGIPIGIQPLWLFIVALMTYSLGRGYYAVEAPSLSPVAAYALGLASALALFAGVLLHELGHAAVASYRGVRVESIDLWLLGGVARMSAEPRRPLDELAIALAGPTVTGVLAVIAGAVHVALGGSGPDWVIACVDYAIFVNATIVVFNLLPAFPLDGGRVLRALLWRRFGDHDRATIAAARAGRGFGFALGAIGAVIVAQGYAGGLWLLLVGGFLVIAAGAELVRTRDRAAFGDATVGEIMSSPPISLPAALPLDDAAAAFSEHLFASFPVVDERGRTVGLLPLGTVKATLPAERHDVTAGEAAARDRDVLVDRSLALGALLRTPSFARLGRAVVVDRATGRPVGVVSVSDIERRLRAAGV